MCAVVWFAWFLLNTAITTDSSKHDHLSSYIGTHLYFPSSFVHFVSFYEHAYRPLHATRSRSTQATPNIRICTQILAALTSGSFAAVVPDLRPLDPWSFCCSLKYVVWFVDQPKLHCYLHHDPHTHHHHHRPKHQCQCHYHGRFYCPRHCCYCHRY